MWRHKVRANLPPLFSRLPHFRGKGRVVLFLDRMLTDGTDPGSYLAEGLVNGDSRLVLDLRVYGQKFAYYYRALEPALLAAARKLYRPGTFLDVGGSIGLWAVALGRQARQQGGRVVSFEPVPHHRERLLHNVRLNGLEDVVELVPCALGDEEGIVGLNPVGPDIADNAFIVPGGTAVAPVHRLDRLVREHDWPEVTFIKIDTEGYDVRVIEGARETIRRSRPVIMAELLRERMLINGLTTAACWEFLVGELGYRCWRSEGAEMLRVEHPAEWENLFFLPGQVSP